MSVKFDARMREWREQIDANLKKTIELSAYPADFREVLDYAVFPGGKRLRPILFLEWHSLFAPPGQAALDFACGLELMHCFSLIHDDMPCIDNDDMRRGKPTVHKKYGEGKALLAGDALLDMAYNCMMNACFAAGNGNPFYFYRLCGENGIIHGEYLDVYGKCRSIEDLISMYKKKTGAIIECACAVGYLFAQKFDVKSILPVTWLENGKPLIEYIEGMTDDERTNVKLIGGALRFGESFGIAFQLYDDLSEYVAGEKSDGTTVMDYIDLDEAKKLLNHYLNGAISVLDSGYNGNTEYLRELTEKFVIV
ncbi:MAG: polyprenyl synthetase family protein [Clostridiales bacterium]|nr:polyprenyl synthetase family protein [Clostridiales bacterium]